MAELREILPKLTREQRQKLLVAMIERCRYVHQLVAVDEAMKIIEELNADG